jgi:hypothetical protein
MGRLLLICRLAVGDVRHRPASAVLLVLAIVTAATTERRSRGAMRPLPRSTSRS